MPLQWTGPYDLLDFVSPRRGWFPQLRHKGVYRLHLVDPSGEHVSLTRLKTSDPTGTLYVGGVPNGVSSTVFDRLKALARTVEHAHTGKQVTHRGGWNLYVFGLLDHYAIPYGGGGGINKLIIFATVDPAWGPADSAKSEAKLLLGYRGIFGDNPPANLSCGHIGQVTSKVRSETANATKVTPADWYKI